MNKKLVMLDIDGTIAEPDGFIHQDTVDAINRVEDMGHHVILASGRSYGDIEPILNKVDLQSEFIIGTNGAVIFENRNGYEVVQTLQIEPDKHIDFFIKRAPDANFVVETLSDGFMYFNEFTIPFCETAPRIKVSEIKDLYGHSSLRIVIGKEEWNADFWMEAIAEYGKGLLGVHKETNNMWVEILHENADKSFAGEHVRKELGIDMKDVIVMGDGHNDVKMFEWANNGGTSYVMGQAHPEVKKHAKHENASVFEQGVAKALNLIF